MYLFDKDKKLRAYADPREILDEFYEIRLDLYETRLDREIKLLEWESKKLSNQVRFINSVVSKEIELNLLSDDSVDQVLNSRGFDRFGTDNEDSGDYNYLLRMPLVSLTLTNSQRLSEQLKKNSSKLKELKNANIKDLWISDLEALEKKLFKFFSPSK